MLYLPIALLVLAIAATVTKLSLRRSLSTQQRLWLIMFCMVYGALPLLLTWAGFSLSQAFGCQVSTITYQCFAPWLGTLITHMVFAHWFAILTLPLSFFNIVVIVLVFISRQFR